MLQNDLDESLQEYNESRPHSGKYCYGKTPMQTFLDFCYLQKRKCCSIVTIFQTQRKYDGSSDNVVTSTNLFIDACIDKEFSYVYIYCPYSFGS